MTKAFASLFRVVLAAAASGLVSIGAANAAVVHLNYDPLFSTTGQYDNLGFSGEGDLFLSDGCLSNSGFVQPGTGTCADIHFTSLTLDLYNFTDGPPPSESVSFVPPLDPAVLGAAVKVIVSPPGDVVGIDTDFIGPIFASAFTSGTAPEPLPNDSHVFLEFVSNFNNRTGTVLPQAFLRICDLNDENCQDSNPATVTFSLPSQQIPEPGTIALLAGALTAAGVALRRRRIV